MERWNKSASVCIVHKADTYGNYDLLTLDSVLGGYCTRILKGEKINIVSPIITPDEKRLFSTLINSVDENQREELIIYYRLAILVEMIILKE